MPVTSPSPLDPSPLQNGIDPAITIQFPHGTRGETAGGGIYQDRRAGFRQIAIPIPSVRVGVT
jgi:hypothetical protein